jgi:serine protease Do
MLVGAFSVYGQSPTTTTTQYPTLTNTTVTNNTDSGKIYYYYEYQDLIDQIYEDVYEDIYNQLYDDIIDQLDDNFHEDIYLEFESRVQELLSESEITLFDDSLQQNIYDIVGLADKSVFGIVNYLGDDVQAMGSGVVYKYSMVEDKYYIITNEHVVNGGNNFSVAFSDGSEYVAELLGYDYEVDIAILKFAAPDKRSQIQVATLGDSDLLTKGTMVIAAGNPQGMNFFGSVTLGIVSGVERKVDDNQYIDYIQHDSAINPGNSGGPIFNLAGEVIGINVSKLADTEIEGIGFAIPINLVKRIITRVEENTLVVNTIMPRLGATYVDVSKLYRNGQVSVRNLLINDIIRTDSVTLTLPTGIDFGFIIQTVERNLALSSTDIKSGDLLYRIDDFLITSEDDYFDYMYENHESGDLITLYYYSLDHDSLIYNLTPNVIEIRLI